MENDTKFVFCDWSNQFAYTNVFDGTHFCCYCGSTEHDELAVHEVNVHDI